MDDQWQRALADVVRAELALSDRTAKDAYTALGISSTAWQTYFKKQTRDIPSRVLIDVAGYLGMPLSELMVKTEARQAYLRSRGPGIDVDKILAESPELAAVREEGQRLTARRTTSAD